MVIVIHHQFEYFSRKSWSLSSHRIRTEVLLETEMYVSHEMNQLGAPIGPENGQVPITSICVCPNTRVTVVGSVGHAAGCRWRRFLVFCLWLLVCHRGLLGLLASRPIALSSEKAVGG